VEMVVGVVKALILNVVTVAKPIVKKSNVGLPACEFTLLVYI